MLSNSPLIIDQWAAQGQQCLGMNYFFSTIFVAGEQGGGGSGGSGWGGGEREKGELRTYWERPNGRRLHREEGHKIVGRTELVAFCSRFEAEGLFCEEKGACEEASPPDGLLCACTRVPTSSASPIFQLYAFISPAYPQRALCHNLPPSDD